jgi:3-hydroxybutyryl-CoA dehydrogenase
MRTIGVLGAGSMGSGIAQVASQCGHAVVLCDTNAVQLEKAKSGLAKTLEKWLKNKKSAQTNQNKFKQEFSIHLL